MDDTVGSLTQIQKSVIIGCILGDGYLRIIPKRKDALLEINHSFSQKEYVNWKYQILKEITVSPPKTRKCNGNRIAYRFYTRQLPALTEIYRMFYKNGRKTIPENIAINPIILSVWYMDDGSKCGKSNFYLNTQQFNVKNQNKLINCLNKIGLGASLNRDKKYFRIRFFSSSINKLKDLLERNLIPSMKYKIGL